MYNIQKLGLTSGFCHTTVTSCPSGQSLFLNNKLALPRRECRLFSYEILMLYSTANIVSMFVAIVILAFVLGQWNFGRPSMYSMTASTVPGPIEWNANFATLILCLFVIRMKLDLVCYSVVLSLTSFLWTSIWVGKSTLLVYAFQIVYVYIVYALRKKPKTADAKLKSCPLNHQYTQLSAKWLYV